MSYPMHYLKLQHWSKFKTNLTTFWGVLAKKPPKLVLVEYKTVKYSNDFKAKVKTGEQAM